MMLPDVNVLVYAHRAEMPDHARYLAWLDDVVNGPQAFGLCELALSGFLRIVTHPKIFKTPSTVAKAIAFMDELRGQPNAVSIAPGPRHFDLFLDLVRQSNAKGNHVPDAYYAALAIEHGCEWITTDGGFGRFAGLRWRHPLAAR